VLRQQKPACILLDLMMPVMDGWQFVTEMEQRGWRKAPLLILSADRAVQGHATRLHAEAYLAKPFDLDELLGRSPPSPAGRTVTDGPRRGLRSLHAPPELGPGLASRPSRTTIHSLRPGTHGEAGEPVQGRASVQRLIGGVAADLRAGRDEEAVAQVLRQRHLVAAEVGSHVCLDRTIGEHRSKAELHSGGELQRAAGSVSSPWGPRRR